MQRIIDREFENLRGSFQSTPEGFSGVFDDVIGREGIKQLGDLVVEGVLEDVNGHLNTVRIRFFFIGNVKFLESLKFRSQSRGVLLVLFFKFGEGLIMIVIKLDQFG